MRLVQGLEVCLADRARILV